VGSRPSSAVDPATRAAAPPALCFGPPTWPGEERALLVVGWPSILSVVVSADVFSGTSRVSALERRTHHPPTKGGVRVSAEGTHPSQHARAVNFVARAVAALHATAPAGSPQKSSPPR